MYISSKVPQQRRNVTCHVYELTSYAFYKPDYAQVFIYTSGTISYSGGTNAFSITRQQAAAILNAAREEGFRIRRKNIGDNDVTTIYTRPSTQVHPQNTPELPTLL